MPRRRRLQIASGKTEHYPTKLDVLRAANRWLWSAWCEASANVVGCFTAEESPAGSYVAAVNDARAGDVVYLDPPYLPISPSASFSKYAKDDFGKLDHYALAGVIRGLSERGVGGAGVVADRPRAGSVGGELSEPEVPDFVCRTLTRRSSGVLPKFSAAARSGVMGVVLLIVVIGAMRLLGKGISKVAMSEADKADRQKATKEKTAQIRYGSNLAEASQQTLATILLNDPDVVLRRAAAGAVFDREVLLRVALRETDPEVLVSAIEKIKGDQAALTRIYRESVSDGARLRAAGYLTNEDVLEYIVLHDKNDLVRHAAVGRVRDERVLLLLACDRDPFVRESACCVLDNQAVLTQVALHDSAEAVRARAIDRLEDLETLGSLMRSDRSSEIRMRAAVRISALEKRAQLSERESKTKE